MSWLNYVVPIFPKYDCQYYLFTKLGIALLNVSFFFWGGGAGVGFFSYSPKIKIIGPCWQDLRGATAAKMICTTRGIVKDIKYIKW